MAMPFEEQIQQIRNFAAQDLLHRVAAYGGLTLLAAILVSVIYGLLSWPMSLPYVAVGMVLLLAATFYVVDPEGQYTKEDIMAVLALSVIFPVLVWVIHTSGTALSQIASPLIMLQEAGAPTAQAISGATVGSPGWFLAMVLIWNGIFGISFGLAELARQWQS